MKKFTVEYYHPIWETCTIVIEANSKEHARAIASSHGFNVIDVL
jgi:hypothetical protein